MPSISRESGYQMIVNNRIPKLTIGYIKKNIVDRDVWADLFTTHAEQNLRIAIKRHLSGLGANVTEQLIGRLVVDEQMLRSLRSKYSQW